MSDPKLSLPAPTSVRLEPRGNNWQLVIDLDAETALAIADRLFDYVDRVQRERQRREASCRQSLPRKQKSRCRRPEPPIWSQRR